MLKKDLKLYSESRSQLVTHYINACKAVYGVSLFIHEKLYSKFSVFEADLRELGIPPKDYAYTVAAAMKNFVLDRGMKCLPINLFLSDYCIKRYTRISNTKTADIKPDNIDVVLFHDELLVARLFIEKNVNSTNGYHRMTEVVDELKPLLSKEWLQVYSNKKTRPEIEVVDQLCEEYGISKPMQSYLDIVSTLR